MLGIGVGSSEDAAVVQATFPGGFRPGAPETPAHSGLRARVEGFPRGGTSAHGLGQSGRGAVPLHPESPPRALRPPAPDYSDREVVRWKEEDCGAREWASVATLSDAGVVQAPSRARAVQRDADNLRRRMFQTGFVGVERALSEAQVEECYRVCAEGAGQLLSQLARLRDGSGDQHMHDAAAATRVFRSVGLYAKDHSPKGDGRSLEFLMPALQRHAYLHHDSPWMPFCRSVLGPDAVTLLIGCLWAEPGAERGPWHSEGAHLFQSAQIGYALPPHALTVSVPLMDVVASGNGAPQFVPGSHWHPYHQWGVGRNSPGLKGEAIVELNMDAGSAVMADYRLHSRSGANASAQPRCILYALVARPWFRDLSAWSAGAYLMFQPLSTLQEQSDIAKADMAQKYGSSHESGAPGVAFNRGPASMMDLESISASHADEGRSVSNVLRQYGYDKDGEELEHLIQSLVVSFFQGGDAPLEGNGQTRSAAEPASSDGVAPSELARPASPSLRSRAIFEEDLGGQCSNDDGEEWLRQVFGLTPDDSDDDVGYDPSLMDTSSASKRVRLTAVST